MFVLELSSDNCEAFIPESLALLLTHSMQTCNLFSKFIILHLTELTALAYSSTSGSLARKDRQEGKKSQNGNQLKKTQTPKLE